MNLNQETVRPLTGLDDTEEKRLLRILWGAYISMWGPPLGSPSRSEHHENLHTLMDYMEDLKEAAHFKASPEWILWVDSLPGYISYWSNDESYNRHHEV